MVLSEKEVFASWRACCKVYGSYDDALAAVRKNQQIILPYVTNAQNIAAAYKALQDVCGKEDAASIIRKNPGVLACNARSLAETSKEEIEKAANFVVAFDSLPAGVKAAIPILTFFALVGVVGGRIATCSGGACGTAAEWDLKGGLGVQFVNFVQGLLS